MFRLRAPAKVNLVLEVLGRRSDGYHDLATVVHPIALYDDVTVGPAADIEVAYQGEQIEAGDDLVRRAALALQSQIGTGHGARVECRKRIPLGSGLGGGSSDAAATLRLLSRLWGASRGRHRLRDLAAALGSDVPLFLESGAALVRGRGDLVAPLPTLRAGWAVLVPRRATFADKTRRLFAAMSPALYGAGDRAEMVAGCLRHGVVPDAALLHNAFEPLARKLHPGLGRLQDALQEATGKRFSLSGAGPSLFTLLGSRAAARSTLAACLPIAPDARLVRLVGTGRILRTCGTDLAS